MSLLASAAAVAAGSSLAQSEARSLTTSKSTVDESGTILLNGEPIFPIALTTPPPLGAKAPSGANGLDEVVQAGVNFFRVGPAYKQWQNADIADVKEWDRAAVLRGVHTIISVNTLSAARSVSRDGGLLGKVVTSLTSDPYASGIGLWKGADEPLKAGVPPSVLRFAYCRVTSRGDRRWCAGKPPLDPAHLWLTIQAPFGRAAELARYSKVTDMYGVDVYPVTAHASDPYLHDVGIWTHTLGAVTPDHSTWTTLPICFGGSSDRTGEFVVPDRLQERYMIYDAIINGARGLGFFGGDKRRCWNATDQKYHWNWTFWTSTLRDLIEEINARSPLAPALLDPDSTRQLVVTDPTTQAISRGPGKGEHIWVIAARSGEGDSSVTISGLPPTITHGVVYEEGRTIPVTNGSFTDTFQQWQVHVYDFATESPHA